MLHLFSAAPHKKELLQICLSTLTADDVLVLLGDAIVFASEALHAQVKLSKTNQKNFNVCFVAEDLARLGDLQKQSSAASHQQVTVISTAQLVRIATEHDGSQSWY